MTEKELLYMEDALAKEQFIMKKINIIAAEISDKEALKLLDDMLSVHKKNYKNLEKQIKEEL